MRFTVPTGKISIDFPQNLFFHLTSEKEKRDRVDRDKVESINVSISIYFSNYNLKNQAICVSSVNSQLDIKKAN